MTESLGPAASVKAKVDAERQQAREAGPAVNPEVVRRMREAADEAATVDIGQLAAPPRNTSAGAISLLLLTCAASLGRVRVPRWAWPAGLAAGMAWLAWRLAPSTRPQAQPAAEATPQVSPPETPGVLPADAPWWVPHICAKPARATTTVQPSANELEFIENLLGDRKPIRFVLDQVPGRQPPDPDQTVLMVRYPSRAIRSLASTATVGPRQIEFMVDDRTVFLDPAAPAPMLTGHPVELEMELFAVDCEVMSDEP